ncbi:MAG: hypothetical protein D6722_29460 [Bacteroidetes bacterium]|nr:MAG: hypothetical protein D6722_29460 [Bacteroidota bacterium]
MPSFFIPLFSLLLLVSCAPGNHEQQQGEPEAVAGHPPAPMAVFVPDTSIGPIRLFRTDNVDAFLGEDVMDRLVEDMAELPAAHVLSRDGAQMLTVFFHPGGYAKAFSEVRVRYTGQPAPLEPMTDVSAFITESGIRLGMPREAIESLKGLPDSISGAESITLHYWVDDFEGSPFLQRYNMPSYYAGYEFKEDTLVRFQFGFEYP